MQWKDISSYSQRDTDRTPKTWALKAAGLNIVVTRHIHHAPDAWVLSCEPFCGGIEIGTGTADEAKAAAVEIVRMNLEQCLAALTPNAPHEGRTAALSPGVPLDAVVGGQESALTGRQ